MVTHGDRMVTAWWKVFELCLSRPSSRIFLNPIENPGKCELKCYVITWGPAASGVA